MKTNYFIAGLLFTGLLFFSACEKEEVNVLSNFTLDIEGLEDLGSEAVYEGWVIVDGNPISTGVFTVDESGVLSQTRFTIDTDDMNTASTFVLTIEPSPDPDPAPSAVHILAGDFDGNDASLSIDHSAALGTDFSGSTGSYIVATPTDGPDNHEDAGVWFLDLSSGSPSVGLDLDVLPEGWAYEGWVVIDGIPVSTGTFTDPAGIDASAIYSGGEAGPPFPGEDFVSNAPAGLSFPTSILGGTAVISVEPVPDNSAAPFTLKPLVGAIDASSDVHTTYSLGQNLTFPTGTVTR